ncbi:MAG: hypothetical protein OHK0056_26530 [Bacteriovoracaceae bacterium]
MFAIKNLNGFQNSIVEHVTLLEDILKVIETENEKNLDTGVMEKLSEIYQELMAIISPQEFASLFTYFKECSEVCSYCVRIPDNPKANRKVLKILSDSLTILKDMQSDLSDRSNQFKIMQKLELANFHLNRLSRSEFYSIWKERQKAS